MRWILLIHAIFITSCFVSESYSKNLQEKNGCPCSDPKYCERIVGSDRREVFGFSNNITHYKQYDWEKLTTIVVYEGMLEKYGMGLVCLAHKHDTRVLIATAISRDQLVNATARAEVVDRFFNLGEKYFMDGANVDVELVAIDPIVSNGLTSYVKETKEKWKASYPHSMISNDVSWIPNIFQDLSALANHSDIMFLMEYDDQGIMLEPCVARANAPFAQTQFSVAAFKALGLPGHKLVLGVPWYGYKYDCLKLTEHDLCYIEKKGGICTQSAGSQLLYSNIMKILPHSMGGRKWSDVYGSPFFNYQDSTGIHQIWYDDAESLKMKYALAEKYDLMGVGMFSAECLDYTNASDPTTKEMWDALPSYK